MNRSEIRTSVRKLLNESTAGFWSDDDLNNYINMANQRVNSIIAASRSDFFTVSATFNTISGTKSYAWPTDCKYIRRIEVYDTSDPSNILKLDEMKFPRTEAVGSWDISYPGQPRMYISRGGQIDLYPIPDSVYPLRIYYEPRQSDLATDSDSPLSPVDFHDMLVYWTCVLAMLQNSESGDEFAGLFNLRKNELLESLFSSGSDDPKTVEGFMENY